MQTPAYIAVTSSVTGMANQMRSGAMISGIRIISAPLITMPLETETIKAALGLIID